MKVIDTPQLGVVDVMVAKRVFSAGAPMTPVDLEKHMVIGAQDLRPVTVQDLGISCMTLSNIFDFYKPQFPRLQNGDSYSKIQS